MPDDIALSLWVRILSESWADLRSDEAEKILGLRLPNGDQKRMEHLGELAQEGDLSAAERRELEEYIRVGHLLSLMKSQARKAIRRRRDAAEGTSTAASSAKRRRRAS